MLDAFLRVEDDVDYGGDAYHGRGGPLPLSRLPFEDMSPVDRSMREAITELGYPTCDDYHAPDSTGVSRLAFTMRDNQRVSTNDAYLEPARSRPNLTVRGDVHVDRILLDGHRARGVRTATGEQIEASEVIVSAGVIHSPALLLRSGIGVDDGLAVGANLKDHVTAWFDLTLNRSGRRASNDGSVASSVLRYSSGMADAGPNDMQILWFNAWGTTNEGLGTGALFVAAMRVFSRGAIRLRSPDPLADPVVEFCMLPDDRDLLRLRDGVRRLTDIVSHPAVASITDTVTADGTPIDQLDSDTAIDTWLRASVRDYVHAVGTCRMGQPGDPGAVVDTDCKVIGYDSLRVCDASVMPDLPKCNTHLTTVAIAERLIATMRA
jgi:5-(hydroxymethyl)furfural/furfural oxidase